MGKLNGVANLVKRLFQAAADKGNGGNDDDGDEGGNKPIFDSRRAIFIFPEAPNESADLVSHFQKLLYHARYIATGPRFRAGVVSHVTPPFDGARVANPFY